MNPGKFLKICLVSFIILVACPSAGIANDCELAIEQYQDALEELDDQLKALVSCINTRGHESTCNLVFQKVTNAFDKRINAISSINSTCNQQSPFPGGSY